MGKLKVDLDQTMREEYRKAGYWGDSTLLDFWRASVKNAPEMTAVVDGLGVRYTFREVDELSDKLAYYLVKEAKVGPGDVITVQIPNWVEFTLTYIAILKAGCVINPVMPKFRENELIFRMRKCNSRVFFGPAFFQKTDHVELVRNILSELPALKKVVLVDKYGGHDTAGFERFEEILERMEPIEEYVRAEADDVAVILFTSGTEGKPKGAMLTHNNLAANMRGYTAATHLNTADSILMSVPVAHATGLMYGVTIPFMRGFKSVLLEQFDAGRSLELIEKERCTTIMDPTVIAVDILHELDSAPDKYDISSLKAFYCGGSPVPRVLLEKGLKLGISILGVYGATESAPHCVVSPSHSIEKVLTTDGYPVLGMQVKIVDEQGNEVPAGVEGEEYSRGPNVFVGYVDEPELTAAAFADGWYKSGDLCYKDADGFVRITGRKKDVIIRGGENISSTEVEGIVMRHENVREVAVVAYPDDRLGERACAYIVLNDASKPMDLKILQEHMKTFNIAKYKWPERVELVDELPRNPSGKVLKYRLREDVKERLKKTPDDRA